LSDAAILGFVSVRDSNGEVRLEMRPLPPPSAKAKGKKARHVPDPINANPEFAAKQLAGFVERRERLEEEKRGIGDDIRDLNSEVKSVGYDLKGFNAIIALRRMESDDRQTLEAILDTYKIALGLA
jgi:uncharacterized protein (UPF0335 family)